MLSPVVDTLSVVTAGSGERIAKRKIPLVHPRHLIGVGLAGDQLCAAPRFQTCHAPA